MTIEDNAGIKTSGVLVVVASMRPPEFTGGNSGAAHRHGSVYPASMRPPEFTGGNQPRQQRAVALLQRFNEAAGIHRRKQEVA